MTFTPAEFKLGQRRTWDESADPWSRWIDKFEDSVFSVTRSMIASSHLKKGDRALDLGCGVGEPSLRIAQHVGPNGFVVGIDQAAEMLAVAEARAEAKGVTNVAFLNDDLEDFNFQTERAFSAIFARYSITFLPSPHECLRKVRDYLKKDGTISIATWGPASEVPAISMGFDILASLLKLPRPASNIPGPFALPSVAAVNEILSDSGYELLDSTQVQVNFRFSGVQEFSSFAWDLLPAWIKRNCEDRFGTRALELFKSELLTRLVDYKIEGGQLNFPGTSPVLLAKRI